MRVAHDGKAGLRWQLRENRFQFGSVGIDIDRHECERATLGLVMQLHEKGKIFAARLRSARPKI